MALAKCNVIKDDAATFNRQLEREGWILVGIPYVPF